MGYEVVDAPRNPKWQPPYGRVRPFINRVEPRNEIQRASLERMEAEDGFLILGTGLGKTVISLMSAIDHNETSLVFVDSKFLMQQWLEEAHEESNLWGLPRDLIGFCLGHFTQWEWQGKLICITTFQSFAKMRDNKKIPADFLEYFDRIYWDEAHTAYSDTRFENLSLFPGRRFALTATPERDGWERIGRMHIGRWLIEEREPEMTPVVRVIPAGFDDDGTEYHSRATSSYNKLVARTLGGPRDEPSSDYLEAVAAEIQKLQARGRKVLVLSSRNAFSSALAEELEDTELINSDVDFRIRRKVLHLQNTCIVTTQIGEKGLNRKDLDALVVTFPFGKSAISRIRQSSGRVLRSMLGKDSAEITLIYPDCKYGEALAIANTKMYRDLRFDIRESPDAPERKRRKPRPHTNRRNAGIRKSRIAVLPTFRKKEK